MKNIIKKALYEAINEVILGQGESFTPYTKKDRERNLQGLTMMRNPSYDKFIEWKEREMAKGRPKKELGISTYEREVLNNKR